MQSWSIQQQLQQQLHQKRLDNHCFGIVIIITTTTIIIATIKSKQGSLFYVDLTWDGPDPTDRVICPYEVDFYCKPSPAESLNSLESGRILLELDLGQGVRSVGGRLLNKAKSENLDKLQDGASRIKRQTSLSTTFLQDTLHANRWTGEISIPASWLEGGTRTHERTGADTPKTGVASKFYSLEITYTLDNNNSCTARFYSYDAFHWHARSK
jgi:hypothetical protein